MFRKEQFIRFTARVLLGRVSVCECASLPFGFDGSDVGFDSIRS